ncbi:MAG TPA: divergent PAP2 family protein [Candidatus Krumholzibacteria bacterium]|nr:divergent PAP2 family protein [Candidatus Krumholzibacteria bacterium]
MASGFTVAPYELVIAAGVGAQLLKFVLYGVANRRPSLRVLVTTNGLPSFYAVTLSCLCTVVALDVGVRSPLFAGSMVFSGVVLHDIVRVQRSVDRGRRSTALVARSMDNGERPEWTRSVTEILRDRGHRPLHIGVGMVLGLLAGLAWRPG